jgi:hypothetical protein
MKTRHWLVALAAIVAAQADVYGLTPPSESDGPVKLLSCTVSPQGILEALVDNRTDDAMDCAIRCTYKVGDTAFSHFFNVTIPRRFSGRLGQFDTSGAKAGDYSGDIGTCKKSPQ